MRNTASLPRVPQTEKPTRRPPAPLGSFLPALLGGHWGPGAAGSVLFLGRLAGRHLTFAGLIVPEDGESPCCSPALRTLLPLCNRTISGPSACGPPCSWPSPQGRASSILTVSPVSPVPASVELLDKGQPQFCRSHRSPWLQPGPGLCAEQGRVSLGARRSGNW